MTNSSKIYGFNYDCDGKTYAFDVQADSEEIAKSRVSAMANASLVGELHALPLVGVEELDQSR